MAKSAAAPSSVEHPRLWRRLPAGLRALGGRQELVILALLVLVAGAISTQSENFFTGTNLLNVTLSMSWFAIAAIGVSIVILVGGVDLSVGAVMALAGLVSALCAQAGLPTMVAVGAGLLSGALVGLANGALVGLAGLPPFIVTLGTMGVARGVALGMTSGAPLRDLPPTFRAIGQSELALGPLLVPLPLIWLACLALLVSLLLSCTVLGRYIYTLGSNERALLLAGVSTRQVKVIVYAMCGMLAACGGVIMTARLGVAAPTAAVGYELDIIAVAVIGGTSLFGGEGSVLGVLLGAALMQIVRNGMVLLGLPAYWQVGVIGAIILTVVLLDYWRRRGLIYSKRWAVGNER